MMSTCAASCAITHTAHIVLYPVPVSIKEVGMEIGAGYEATPHTSGNVDCVCCISNMHASDHRHWSISMSEINKINIQIA